MDVLTRVEHDGDEFEIEGDVDLDENFVDLIEARLLDGATDGVPVELTEKEVNALEDVFSAALLEEARDRVRDMEPDPDAYRDERVTQ